MADLSIIALIPARAGSKRVPGKNVAILAGHPLIAYTIAAARASGVFRDVIVSTDDERTAAIARHYGAEVPSLRPIALAADVSPDFEWVDYVLRELRMQGRDYDAFSILRPTSPFRKPATIERAWHELRDAAGVDSLRAVERCKQHPAKMWIMRGNRLFPVLPVQPEHPPWHSTPYQALPEVYVQNAALEIAWSRCVWEMRTISGTSIAPFIMPPDEAVDINDSSDWTRAEAIAGHDRALPDVATLPYRGN